MAIILILVCNFVFVMHSNMVYHIQDNEDKYIVFGKAISDHSTPEYQRVTGIIFHISL